MTLLPDEDFREPDPVDPFDFIGCLCLLIIWVLPGLLIGLFISWWIR